MSTYRPLRLIANSGPAEVVLAAADDGSLVVLKRLSSQFRDSEMIARFRREAEIAASLDHPNIARIYDVVPDGNACTIVMEYVPGEDLRYLLRGAARTPLPFPLHVSCAIIDGVAAGLEAAHEARTPKGLARGIVHHDISPSNLMVTYDGRVKIVDFGLAKAMDQDRASDPGRLRGKLCYASPEHLSGKAIDHRADLFALGTVAWEMLTSRQLFTGSNEGAIVRNVLERHIPPPSLYNADVAPPLDQIVLGLLRRDVASRISSAGDLRRALAGLVAFEEAPELFVARWMMSAFAASHLQRTEVEEDVLREAAHQVSYEGRELPVAFADSARSPTHGSDESFRRRPTQSNPFMARAPRGLTVSPSPLRAIARGALVVAVGMSVFALVFAILTRAGRSGAGAKGPPANAAARPPAVSPSAEVTAPAATTHETRRIELPGASPPESGAKEDAGPAPEESKLDRDATPSTVRERRGPSADAGHARRPRKVDTEPGAKPDEAAKQPDEPAAGETRDGESEHQAGTGLGPADAKKRARDADEVQDDHDPNDPNPYVYK